MGRHASEAIPAELRDQAIAAGYGNNINGYCTEVLGMPDRWVYTFWERPHVPFLPFVRIARALDIPVDTLPEIIKEGSLREKILKCPAPEGVNKLYKYSNLKEFILDAGISRRLLEDCIAARIDELSLYTYQAKMQQARLSLHILAKRLLN